MLALTSAPRLSALPPSAPALRQLRLRYMRCARLTATRAPLHAASSRHTRCAAPLLRTRRPDAARLRRPAPTGRSSRRVALVRAALLPWAPLIQPSESWSLLAALCTCAYGGAAAGKHTAAGRALSGPVSAMLIAWAAHLCGVLPAPGTHFASLQLQCVTLATPLLLLGADVRAIFARTRRMSAAFGVGALGTVLGSIAGFALLAPLLRPLGVADGDGWKLAAALTAKNIGGGFNYVAVAASAGMSAPALAAGIVCDNVAGLIYFPLINFLGCDAVASAQPAADAGDAPAAAPGLEDLLGALCVSCVITAVAQAFGPSNALPAATALAVLLATSLPGWLVRIAPAGEAIGQVLLYVFFATAGASAGDPSRAAAYAPLFGFLLVLYGTHLAVVLSAGRALGFSLPETLLASNANIGGPATAASMADAAGWTALRTPALLVGNLGNAVATFVGLTLGTGLLRHL